MELFCGAIKTIKEAGGNNSDECITENATSHKNKKRKTSALEKKNERVESIIETLRDKHGGKFTTLQMRLWAEVLDGGSWK